MTHAEPGSVREIRPSGARDWQSLALYLPATAEVLSMSLVVGTPDTVGIVCPQQNV
jgi:hypothetical protein